MDLELTGKLMHIFDRTTGCCSRPSSGKLKNADDISIDHFVPFSYVSSEEFWNLNPTTKSINLPSWERYFNPPADIEFQSYTFIHRYPGYVNSLKRQPKATFSLQKSGRNSTTDQASPELTMETSFPIFWNLSTGQH